MKSLIVCLFVLSLTGCSSALFRDTVICYQPLPGKVPDKQDYETCSITASTRSGHQFCMRLKGYEADECYADTGESLRAKK